MGSDRDVLNKKISVLARYLEKKDKNELITSEIRMAILTMIRSTLESIEPLTSSRDQAPLVRLLDELRSKNITNEGAVELLRELLSRNLYIYKSIGRTVEDSESKLERRLNLMELELAQTQANPVLEKKWRN